MRVGQNIKTIAEAKRISIKELSRMVGIPYTTLYNMVNRNTDRFDLGLLEDIAHSLDVPSRPRGMEMRAPLRMRSSPAESRSASARLTT